MFELNGKVAIVTGAAHGIGRAIAEVFAEAGAKTTIVDIDDEAGDAVASELRKTGHAVTFVHADVASHADVRRVVQMAAEESDRVDILCNNAAYIGQFHDLVNSTPQEWQRCIDVSLMGTVNFSREVLPFMIRRRSGSVINVSSVQGMVGARDSAAYTTVKSGIVGLTRSLAYDFGKHKVRVNALCPGPITTRISPKPGDELYERQVSKTMLGRVGVPREVAYAALFLASDESAYVTGAVLPVDGGWTAI